MTKTSANAAVETTTTVPDSPLARTESIADTVTSAAPTNWSDGNLTPGPPQGEGHAVFAPFVPRLPKDFTTEEELVCRDCKLKVDPAEKGVRMLAKTTKKYQCGNCNSACTVLNYALGGWPSEEFKSWDPETKTNFFRSGMKGSDVKRNYAMTCAKKHIERKMNSDLGEMRPLQYWVNLGYDEHRLKTYTPKEDQTYSDQIGWQFRVNVNSRISETCLEREMQDILSKMAKSRAVKAHFKGAKVEARKLQRRLTKSVSSTSMSSSTSPVKKKKQKKEKKPSRMRKESKEAEKLQRVRKREEERQHKELTGPSL